MFPLGLAAFFATEIFGMLESQFLYGTGIMFALSVVAFVAISLATRAPDPSTFEDVTFDRRIWREESEEWRGKPKIQNYRWLAAGLFVLTIAVIIPFI